MKKCIFLMAFLCSTCHVFAQKGWFTLYQDSTKLKKHAQKITKDFINDIHKISPSTPFSIKSVLNTSPYLIYYNNIDFTANLPLWEQVIPEQKSFFYEVAGGEDEGRIAFGLFFNGFYLPHELGHALQDATSESEVELSYQNEYLANTIAILWWRKHKRTEELKLCYEYAKKMWSKLPNPVPANMSEEEYFTKNYEQASQNPYIYGYMQFRQFMQIYEDKSLPDFDVFIKNYLSK
jgi:hypothetical protein